jgi:hypothetical protein
VIVRYFFIDVVSLIRGYRLKFAGSSWDYQFPVEDPVERVQRLEREVMELRACRLKAVGLLRETRRLLDSLEKVL